MAPLRRQLIYNTRFPEIPGTHFINLKRMKVRTIQCVVQWNGLVIWLTMYWLASVHNLSFNIKLQSFPHFLSKSSEHCWGEFFNGWWEPEKEWFWRFEHFSKLKIVVCEYWTSIKIKIIVCQYNRVWNQNKNSTVAMTTEKNDIFIGL